MRNTTQRSISSNRPVVTITSTVYDRRALDINSDIPLINSLNHLTYLTSNSAKVRETVANDGALDRLVSILRDCHLSLMDCLQFGIKDNDLHLDVTLPNAERIRQQKKLALCSWKWTLAFQCLVLTGTRGTEATRRKVVSSGIISVLATVLDNYLLYYANYDHLKGEYLKFDLKSLNSTNMYLLLSQNHDETFEDYIKELVGKDILDISSDNNFIIDSLIQPIGTKPIDFGNVWSKYKLSKNILNGQMEMDNMDIVDLNQAHCNTKNNRTENLTTRTCVSEGSSNEVSGNCHFIQDDEIEDENCFLEDIEQRPSILSPRSMFLGRIIPKQDDLIWSLQLLAFISKYTYLKPQLQSVELVKSLSFRSIIERVEKRFSQIENNVEMNNENINNFMTYQNLVLPQNIMIPSNSGDNFNTNNNNDNDSKNQKLFTDDSTSLNIQNIEVSNCNSEIDSNIMCELESLVEKCNIIRDRERTVKFGNNSFFDNENKRISPHFIITERNRKELRIVKEFHRNWNYNKISKQLNYDCWYNVKNRQLLNIFPLVEKFTVTPENTHDVIYWSSVIMRNSCRKNEITGVRQCANFDCGKWESYPREFAKCRRCKRTKYCSRKCQLQAWTYHRFWCHEVTCSSKTTTSTTDVNTREVSPNTTGGLANAFSTTISNEQLTSVNNNGSDNTDRHNNGGNTTRNTNQPNNANILQT
ncbi:MYND-type zinc finger protein MUB1 PWA37_004141 [Arxiozyma heterogenica]|uniref:MYND-type domain-containing protein n=1 Tax=Arxiozyma heterogenica TaxID=278026 RepID=A0AAN7WPR8_9SACH|nr:hypothetical protein RI543_003161 [Kazachstania heterogenica]